MASIVLHGPACDQVKQGAVSSVTIVFRCLIR